MSGHVVAMGGWCEPIVAWALRLTGRDRPRALYVPTAIGDDEERIAEQLAVLARLGAEPDVLRLFGVPERPLERVADADLVLVNGGNTADMLAVWRVHGIDRALRDAHARGAVLAGWSAGANCWFEGSVTDSFSAELQALPDGLGVASGSFCPHVDSEQERLPVHSRLVAAGALPPGIACDDAAAAWLRGVSLERIVVAEAGARAFAVDGQDVRPLPVTALSAL